EDTAPDGDAAARRVVGDRRHRSQPARRRLLRPGKRIARAGRHSAERTHGTHRAALQVQLPMSLVMMPATATQPPLDTPIFRALEPDDTPALLEASYRLRYQVYCRERGFLPAECYPDEIETDAFDAHAVHLGVLNMD